MIKTNFLYATEVKSVVCISHTLLLLSLSRWYFTQVRRYKIEVVKGTGIERDLIMD